MLLSINACYKINHIFIVNYVIIDYRELKQSECTLVTFENSSDKKTCCDLPLSRFESTGDRRFGDLDKSLPFMIDVNCTGP